MLKKKQTKWIASLALALLAVVSRGAIAAEPWYQVEVIVFSQQDMFGDEAPHTNIQLSYPESNWVTLKPASAQSSAFARVNRQQRQLGPEHYTLRRTPGYRVLYHAAWRQPGLSLANSPWILIRGGEKQSDGHYELEGSLRLVKTRFLHIQADLWKTRFLKPGQSSDVVWPALPVRPTAKPQSQPSEVSATGDSAEIASELNTPDNILDIVTLKGAEKLTLGELAYLDHPNMGILVRVDRYQAPETP